MVFGKLNTKRIRRGGHRRREREHAREMEGGGWVESQRGLGRGTRAIIVEGKSSNLTKGERESSDLVATVMGWNITTQ